MVGKRKVKKVASYYCPGCKVNLRGEPIPKKYQKFYGATHYGREIGIYNLDLDCVVLWECPDCHGRFDRLTSNQP